MCLIIVVNNSHIALFQNKSFWSNQSLEDEISIARNWWTKVLVLIMLLSTFRLMFHSSKYLSLSIYVVNVDLKVSIYGFWNKITLKNLYLVYVIVGHLDIDIILRLKAFLMSILLHMHCCCCAALPWFMRDIMIGWHLVKADGDYLFLCTLVKLLIKLIRHYQKKKKKNLTPEAKESILFHRNLLN